MSAIIDTKKPMTPKERWSAEIEYAEKEQKKFWDRGEIANNRFLDERDATTAEAKKFNIFYANTNILESALYSQVPKPSVSRRYTDYRDQVGRVAALVLERALGQDLNDPDDMFDSTMRQAVQDRLVPGLGTAWLRLETETEDIPESEGGQLTNDTQSTAPEAGGGDEGFDVPATSVESTILVGLPGQPPAPQEPSPEVAIPLKKIKDQRVAVDYVYWKDFLWSPCRVWSERRWVARKTYLDRKQMEKRFGEAKAKLCSYDYSSNGTALDRSTGGTTPQNDAVKKAVVYEIWDRMDRKVYWWCKGSPEILDEKDDFLKLQSFEPCPTPMFANTTTSNCTPRPDYYMIQDQYGELDTVNARISLLVSACKVVGVYNKNSIGVGDMLQGAENKMIPVDNWAQFGEKGGVKGNIDWLPLEQIIQTLQRLYEAREAIKGQIYELTGIADIVRGASKASETLGAQQIKAQFASVRIKKLQDEVARFASDILRIKAEIMVKHFDPEILIRKSGITRTDNDQWVVEAIVTIKSEEGFNWRIKIQSDSMAQADYAMEKKERIEFMSAVTGYMANALPMTMQIPETKPIVLGVLKWGLAAFKEADDIEGMLDKQIAMLEGKPPAPPPVDPKIKAAEMKAQTDKQKAQFDMQAQQQKHQMEIEEQQADMAMKEKEMAMQEQMNIMKMGFEKGMNEMKMAMERFKLEMMQAQGQQKMQQEGQKGQIELEQTQLQGDLQTQQSQEQHELAMQTSEQQAEQSLAQGEAQGEQKLKLNAKAAAQKPAPAKPKGK